MRIIEELKGRLKEYLDFEGIEQKYGKYRCINPQHVDTEPSLKVYGDHAYCFGCHTMFDTITAYMTIHGVNRETAIRELCSIFKLDPPPLRADVETAKYVMRVAYNLLSEVRYSEQTVKYLLSKGISLRAARTFGVLQYDESVFKELARRFEKSYEALCLNQLKTDGFLYTVFDVDGSPIAFVARNFNFKPKFWNPPNTVLYKKSHELYGQHFVRSKSVVLVEGYSDALSAWAHGKINVLGLGCAAISEGTVERLEALGVKRVALCFDGDSTGVENMLRGILKLQRAGFEVYAALLKEGTDPDDYFKHNLQLPIQAPEVVVWHVTRDIDTALEYVNQGQEDTAIHRLAEVTGLKKSEIAIRLANIIQARTLKLRAIVEQAEQARQKLEMYRGVIERVKAEADVATAMGIDI